MFLRPGRAQPRSPLSLRSRRLPRHLALLHAVADAGLGEDIAGIARVVAQLAAQPPHDVSHRRGVLPLVRSPDPLQQVRWFTGNHGQQFGRLLTPLVNGIRVRGSFQPDTVELQDDDRRLVLLDGEGLGHSAREATSVSTKVTERFPETDMILLVDNAQSPMQAAPLELLRSVGSSGHGDKLAVVFTHFDQVQGDNLGSHSQKVNHVRASIGNAIVSLRESLGAPVTEILERQLNGNDFYLGGLNQPTGAIALGFIKDMRRLMERMQQSAHRDEHIDAAPVYNLARLELARRDATDGFKNPWEGRLGLSYYEGIRKEHWGALRRCAGASQICGTRSTTGCGRLLT